VIEHVVIESTIWFVFAFGGFDGGRRGRGNGRRLATGNLDLAAQQRVNRAAGASPDDY
jgi:hypothetical protein